MRRIIFLSLMIVMLFSTGASQEILSTTLSLSGGLSVPLQPSVFSNYWKKGFNIGAGVEYELSPVLSLGGFFEYNSFSFNPDRFLSDYGSGGSTVTIAGGTAKIVSIVSTAKAYVLPSSESIAPYLLGGIGFLRLNSSDVTVSTWYSTKTVSAGSESALLILVGAGANIPVADAIKVFIEIPCGVGFTGGDRTIYLTVKTGVTYTL